MSTSQLSNPFKLEIGSGRGSHRADHVTIDSNPNYNATYVAAVPPLPQGCGEAETWDEIIAIHFIDHLYEYDAQRLSEQCFYALKPDGVLIYELGDISKAARLVVEGRLEGLRWIFGEQDPARTSWAHRWGYTPETMASMLVSCGFAHDRVKILPATKHKPRIRDFRVEATK